MTRTLAITALLAAGLGLAACAEKETEAPEPELDAGHEPDASMDEEDAGEQLDASEADADAAPEPEPEDPYEVCSADDWCFALPKPTDRGLFAAAASEGQLWLAGERGSMLRFDGNGLRSMASGVDLHLRAAFALSASDLWVTGDKTTVLHSQDGATFTTLTLPAPDAGVATMPSLLGVWASAPNDAWMVGEFGTLVHYDGTSLSRVTSPTGERLNAVHGFAANSVFAVGYAATLLRFDGTTWTRSALPGGGNFTALHGLSATDLWAVGLQGRVLHFNGTTWSPVELTLPKVDLYAVREVSPTEVVVAGKGGALYVYDGMVWRARTSGTTSDLYGLTPGAEGELFAFGARGSFSGWQGETRTSYALGSSKNRLDAFGTPGGPLWIVGDETLRLDALGTEVIEAGTDRSLFGGFALSEQLAWAVGTAGTIVRWNGDAFTLMSSGTDRALRAVWAASSSSAWVVGARGTVLGLFNGSKWVAFSVGSTVDLFDVWGAADDDIWIAGDMGLALHWDGGEWRSVPTSTTASLRSLWGDGPDDVWAAGTLGTLVHWNGKAWAVEASGEGYSLNGVWGAATDDVYAVGSGGTILHFDGESWSQELAPTDATLFSVRADADGIVHAVGEGGVVLWKRVQN
jgi:hypothetical protein